ncbi:MAG: ATP-binding protein [Ignavibacteriaceae bacterium]|nr:ATP-binding protein [Ignavibacteriaceae bacterium]
MDNQKLTILLVEDSAITARLVTEAINEGLGNDFGTIERTEDLETTLSLLAAKVFDVILLDLGLPDSFGIDTFRSVYQKSGKMPIVVFTGNDDQQLALQAVREGAQDYLVKGTVSGNLLSRTIGYAIERGKIKNELLNVQEQLMKRSEELELLNATKDKFFSIIAHDLKNPFYSIIGLADIVINDFHELSKDDSLSYIQSIRNSAQYSYELLSNLLEWANMQTGRLKFNPVSFDLTLTASKSYNLMKMTAAKKGIELELAVEDELAVYADENMINTVLRNLVTNAIKFTNEGGKIIVRAERDGGKALISIIDNGIGMSEKIKEKIFRIDVSSSTRGTANERGTGLGLILCKEFIEENGGNVWFESEQGKGTTFYFTVPLALA